MGIKLIIAGYGESGKDTVAQWFKENTVLRYTKSTSLAAAELVYREWGYQFYKNVEDCWLDRRCNRQRWQDLILDYNQKTGHIVTGKDRKSVV